MLLFLLVRLTSSRNTLDLEIDGTGGSSGVIERLNVSLVVVAVVVVAAACCWSGCSLILLFDCTGIIMGELVVVVVDPATAPADFGLSDRCFLSVLFPVPKRHVVP